MENVKPWQIILIVIAFAVLGFSVLKFGIGGSVEGQMANEMMLIDVQTGQLYIRDISGKRAFIIPDRNPDTRKIALIPVYEEDGEWFLEERYLGAIEQIEVPTDAVSSPKKPLKVTDSEPIRLN